MYDFALFEKTLLRVETSQDYSPAISALSQHSKSITQQTRHSRMLRTPPNYWIRTRAVKEAF